MWAASEGPIHPKFARELEKGFSVIKRIGGSIRSDLQARKQRRTWADSSPVTMFMD